MIVSFPGSVNKTFLATFLSNTIHLRDPATNPRLEIFFIFPGTRDEASLEQARQPYLLQAILMFTEPRQARVPRGIPMPYDTRTEAKTDTQFHQA